MQKVCALLPPCLLLEHFYSVCFLWFEVSLTKYRMLFKKLETLTPLDNTLLTSLLLRASLRCLAMSVELRGFLNNALPYRVVPLWSFIGLLEPSGQLSSMLHYLYNSLLGGKRFATLLSLLKVAFLLRGSLEMHLPSSFAREKFLFCFCLLFPFWVELQL